MASHRDKEGESTVVEEPTEVDVLCGRGGMSNHHPGNEWYRRLIRSNRPLYRACPKHTKLLVSKAIVQAVEQQGGRFLEKDKKTGYFVKVSHKRAVDKTSQGLRERDRDDEDDEDDDDDVSDANEDSSNKVMKKKRSGGMIVPEEFSGRNKTPNMNDLATVAIGMTNRGGDQKRHFVGGGESSTPDNKRHKKVQQVVVGMKSHADLLADDDDDDVESETVRVGQNLGARGFSSVFDQTAFNSQQIDLLQRQLSLQRQASLNLDYFGVSAAVPPRANMEMPSQTLLPNFQQSYGFQQGLQNSVSFPMGAMPGIYWVNPAASPTPLAFMPMPTMDASPPPLSRLTSQVSDWLTSFWPLVNAKSQDFGQTANTDSTSSEESSSASERIPTAITKQLKIPAPLDTDRPQITTIPPPVKRPILTHPARRKGRTKQTTELPSLQQQSNLLQTMKAAQQAGVRNGLLPNSSPSLVTAEQQAQLQAWHQFHAQHAALQQQYERQDVLGNPKVSAQSITHRDQNKRKSRPHNMPPLPYDNAVGVSTASATAGATSDTSSRVRQARGDSSANGVDDLHLTAPPTELEQSVSTTLLKLAGSRLISGLTSFYDRPQGTGNVATTGQENANDTIRPSSKRTLLDDYEETEEEARIRAVDYKR